MAGGFSPPLSLTSFQTITALRESQLYLEEPWCLEPPSALMREEAILALMYSCMFSKDGGKGSDPIQILPFKSSLFSSPVEISCSFLQEQLHAGLWGWAGCVKTE